MALYERLMGIESPKIPVHGFMAMMQEYVLGNVTAGQATTAFALSGAEQTQALALRDRILTESSASANIARRMKAIELENVLILAESGIAPFDTVVLVKTRLGVP